MSDFRTLAACRGQDPELFFPAGDPATGPNQAQTRRAKRVCAGCPVRTECLTWALEHGEDVGIWGGLTADERRAIKQRPSRPCARTA